MFTMLVKHCTYLHYALLLPPLTAHTGLRGRRNSSGYAAARVLDYPTELSSRHCTNSNRSNSNSSSNHCSTYCYTHNAPRAVPGQHQALQSALWRCTVCTLITSNSSSSSYNSSSSRRSTQQRWRVTSQHRSDSPADSACDGPQQPDQGHCEGLLQCAGECTQPEPTVRG
jgi:hypothetical protein